jgi:hypothetical protein
LRRSEARVLLVLTFSVTVMPTSEPPLESASSFGKVIVVMFRLDLFNMLLRFLFGVHYPVNRFGKVELAWVSSLTCWLGGRVRELKATKYFHERVNSDEGSMEVHGRWNYGTEVGRCRRNWETSTCTSEQGTVSKNS